MNQKPKTPAEILALSERPTLRGLVVNAKAALKSGDTRNVKRLTERLSAAIPNKLIK